MISKILDAVIDLGMTLLEQLLSVFDIPPLPDEFQTVLNTVTGYLTTGIALLQNYTHMQYLLSLLGFIIAFDGCLLIYKGIMWILRKIPMLGMS